MRQYEQWQVVGNAVEVYERYLVPAVFQPWAAILTGLALLRPGERVLEVACGTGVVACLTAQHVGPTGKVVSLDLNPGMLTVARAFASNLSSAIEWQEGDVLAMPFSKAAFDVVACQLGLRFFPDRPGALREMHRVLVAGGRLTLMV